MQYISETQIMSYIRSRTGFIPLLFFISLGFSSCMNEPEIQPNTNVGNFEALWKIIDTKYCYLDYKNINWDSIHDVYKHKIDSTLTYNQLFDTLGNMLSELKDGHVNLYSSFDLSSYKKWYTDYPANFTPRVIYGNRYLGSNYLIAGGMRYQRIANDSIGYIYYGDFSNRFSDTNILYILNYFKNCKGLIIDVRNNGGGYLDLSEQLASYFFERDTITGYMQHKTGNGHNSFSSPSKITTTSHKKIKWQRPVIILTNRMSYSATNSFVSRMKIAPNALIIGDKTGGGGGLPLSSELPNGWMVRFSSSPMFDSDMQHIEWGIFPDLKVDMKATDEENDIDTIIERAIKILN